MKVLNHDICGLVRRLDRFVVETHKAVSASLSHINAFDRTRAAEYLTAARSYHAWAVAQPELDLPESAPMEYEVGDGNNFGEVESEDLNDLIRMWELTRLELINSQSARMAAGMMSHDSNRFLALVEKMENFLTTYVDVISPLDLPESSPKTPVAGPGRGGI